MNYRKFGNTELTVSEIGFGAWAIGGPAMAGEIPIGWGEVDDHTSIEALTYAMDCGINFYDTADFYGLGHSEELIGNLWGNRKDVVIATKVGHRLDDSGNIWVDYTGDYIKKACEDSLGRLKRDAIDFYQLHTAKVSHMQAEDCISALKELQQEGKIRYWGVSLNTYNPFDEAEYLYEKKLGHGIQVVLNIINQRAVPTVQKMGSAGWGVIARMPLQFGLLTGKFTPQTTFSPNDHRSFRLTADILQASLSALDPVWALSSKYDISHAELALSYILSYKEVSTVIPGMKTKEQVKKNSMRVQELEEDDREFFEKMYVDQFVSLLEMMEQKG